MAGVRPLWTKELNKHGYVFQWKIVADVTCKILKLKYVSLSSILVLMAQIFTEWTQPMSSIKKVVALDHITVSRSLWGDVCLPLTEEQKYTIGKIELGTINTRNILLLYSSKWISQRTQIKRKILNKIQHFELRFCFASGRCVYNRWDNRLVYLVKSCDFWKWFLEAAWRLAHWPSFFSCHHKWKRNYDRRRCRGIYFVSKPLHIYQDDYPFIGPKRKFGIRT